MDGVIIFWHIFFLVLGFLVGILVGRRIERRSAPPAAQVLPEGQPAAAVDSAALKAGRGPAGKLWVELEGKQLQAGQKLDADQQRTLTSILLDIRPWLMAESPVKPVEPIPPTPLQAASAVPVSPVPVVTARPVKKEAPAAPVMKSIIEQINDVLQAHLSTSPFKDRGIELVEASDGSVIVVDGTHKYPGIESIPDAEVQALIRQSVAEWEKNAK